ncbi:hypothetical protein ACIBHX_50445 [Nonomuraea sp. NPDC050536]|uniref:hypothetical protein n=1 Tax=Nonomuraea sp. NPDC050536 TaxID=3364366 RepID=UPI0037CA7178
MEELAVENHPDPRRHRSPELHLREGTPPPPGQPEHRQIKTDKDGNTIYETVLMAEGTLGRLELVKVNTTSEPSIIQSQDVIPRGMLGYVWEISQGGQARWGISCKAADIVPAGGGWSGCSLTASTSTLPGAPGYARSLWAVWISSYRHPGGRSRTWRR